jgi:hypothetical protein
MADTFVNRASKDAAASGVSISLAVREVFGSPDSLNVLALLLILPGLQSITLWLSQSGQAAPLTLFLLVLALVLAFLSLLFLGQVAFYSAKASAKKAYQGFLEKLSLRDVFGNWRMKFELLLLRLALAMPLFLVALVIIILSQFDATTAVAVALSGSIIWLIVDSIFIGTVMFEYERLSSNQAKQQRKLLGLLRLLALLKLLNLRKLWKNVRAAGKDNTPILLVALLLPIVRVAGGAITAQIADSPLLPIFDLLLTGLIISIQVLLISHLQGQLWKKYF